MRHIPWSESVWQPSERSSRATRRGEVYSVRLTVQPAVARDALWEHLGAQLTPGETGLLDGGAALRCVGKDGVEVTSGGEDVLDSLSYSLNVTLAEAAQRINQPVSLHVDDEYPPGQRT